jgi:hypothetical protein
MKWEEKWEEGRDRMTKGLKLFVGGSSSQGARQNSEREGSSEADNAGRLGGDACSWPMGTKSLFSICGERNNRCGKAPEGRIFP